MARDSHSTVSARPWLLGITYAFTASAPIRCGWAAATLLLPASVIAAQRAQAPTLVIRRVSVLPMDRDTILLNHDVLIAGSRIVDIVLASQNAPPGVSTIDGTGKFVAIDAHRCA